MLPMLVVLNVLLAALLAAALYGIFFSPRFRRRRAQMVYVLLFLWPLAAALANMICMGWFT